MTKIDLIEALVKTFGQHQNNHHHNHHNRQNRQNHNFTQTECAQLVEIFLDSIKESLAAGHATELPSLKISGFGTWQVREKEERMGRNPQTGESLPISARRVVTFRASQKLRDGVNK